MSRFLAVLVALGGLFLAACASHSISNAGYGGSYDGHCLCGFATFNEGKA